MTNSTQDMARDRARATLTVGIAQAITEIAMQRFVVQNDPRPILAIDEVLNYAETCEESGITMHPADVRRLIASALGVSS